MCFLNFVKKFVKNIDTTELGQSLFDYNFKN